MSFLQEEDATPLVGLYIPTRVRGGLAEGGDEGGDEGDPADEWRPHRWVLIHPDAPLMLPLVQPAHVVADVPVLYVVPRDTPWWRDMRAAAGGAFARLEWKEPPTVTVG